MDVEHLRWERWKEGRTGGREEEEEETEQATSASARSTSVPGLIPGLAGVGRSPYTCPASQWRTALERCNFNLDMATGLGRGVGAEAPISRAPSPGELVMRFPDPHSH